MVTIAIPLLCAAFLVIHRHYRIVARRLRAGAAAVRFEPPPENTTVVYVEDIGEATELAAWYGRLISGRALRAVHPLDPGRPDPRGSWWEIGRVPLDAIETRDGRSEGVLDYLWSLPHGGTRFVTLVVPETFLHASLVAAVTRRTTFPLKVRLRREAGIVVANVPIVAGVGPLPAPAERRPAVRLLVSGVQAASLRAMRYAETLGVEDSRAVFLAFEDAEEERMRVVWEREEVPMPLDVVRAPYRDIGPPLVSYVRSITADPDAIVSVVMPELVFSGWRSLLHNQRALYLKRLLLFEPRVILSSVPYRLP
jgi:hypothetical protein